MMTDRLPTLDVAIATHGPAGLGRVAAMQLPRVEGVRYVVSLQNGGDAQLPDALQRDDVEVHPIECACIADNRNNAFDHCRGDVILVADDDLIYTADRLRAVQEAFRDRPAMDYALFKADSPDGKFYPDEESEIGRQLPRGLTATSFEIAFRQEVNKAPARWDPNFGPGSAHSMAGDDEVFALTLRRMGLRGRFIPVTITCHPGWSSGVKPIDSPRFGYGLGAYIAMSWPVTALPRIFLKAWRMQLSGQCRGGLALSSMLRGWMYSFTYKRPWRRR